MNRPLSAPASDIALVLTRVIFAVVMIAHGWEKLFIKGIGRTTEGFEKLDIPLAIVSASFVTVMELAGAIMLLAGALHARSSVRCTCSSSSAPSCSSTARTASS